jgi:hypothetical protein
MGKNATQPSSQEVAQTMQAQLNALNSVAGAALDADEGMVDEQSYKAFAQHASLPNLLQWMRFNPHHAPKISERKEELSLQIQHRLIDLAASTKKRLRGNGTTGLIRIIAYQRPRRGPRCPNGHFFESRKSGGRFPVSGIEADAEENNSNVVYE